jgi:hypothetical protein
MSIILTGNKDLKNTGLLTILIFSFSLDTNRMVRAKREGLAL